MVGEIGRISKEENEDDEYTSGIDKRCEILDGLRRKVLTVTCRDVREADGYFEGLWFPITQSKQTPPHSTLDPSSSSHWY
jgi:hypothetical protein